MSIVSQFIQGIICEISLFLHGVQNDVNCFDFLFFLFANSYVLVFQEFFNVLQQVLINIRKSLKILIPMLFIFKPYIIILLIKAILIKHLHFATIWQINFQIQFLGILQYFLMNLAASLSGQHFPLFSEILHKVFSIHFLLVIRDIGKGVDIPVYLFTPIYVILIQNFVEGIEVIGVHLVLLVHVGVVLHETVYDGGFWSFHLVFSWPKPRNDTLGQLFYNYRLNNFWNLRNHCCTSLWVKAFEVWNVFSLRFYIWGFGFDI